MARGARGKGGGRGPGGIVASALILLLFFGGIFAFAKANNINDAASLIDWTRSTSDKLRSCMQPDVKFWTCSFGGGSGATPGDGSATPGDGTEPSTPGAGESAAPAPVTSEMLQKLAAIRVGDPQEIDYDRAQWKHWIGDRCNDTRQQVLREQAMSFELDGDGCRVVSGKWIDPYTGAEFTDPAKLDIDHVYALSAAARNGGNSWDAARKEAFANDKEHLLAVSSSANRSKSDRNPAEWWPENEAFSCDFATRYVNIAAKYDLQFSQADVKALEKGLKTCG